MKNKCAAVSSTTWEELEQEIYTPEEIVESDRRVAEMSRAIRMAVTEETETVQRRIE